MVQCQKLQIANRLLWGLVLFNLVLWLFSALDSHLASPREPRFVSAQVEWFCGAKHFTKSSPFDSGHNQILLVQPTIKVFRGDSVWKVTQPFQLVLTETPVFSEPSQSHLYSSKVIPNYLLSFLVRTHRSGPAPNSESPA